MPRVPERGEVLHDRDEDLLRQVVNIPGRDLVPAQPVNEERPVQVGEVFPRRLIASLRRIRRLSLVAAIARPPAGRPPAAAVGQPGLIPATASATGAAGIDFERLPNQGSTREPGRPNASGHPPLAPFARGLNGRGRAGSLSPPSQGGVRSRVCNPTRTALGDPSQRRAIITRADPHRILPGHEMAVGSRRRPPVPTPRPRPVSDPPGSRRVFFRFLAKCCKVRAAITAFLSRAGRTDTGPATGPRRGCGSATRMVRRSRRCPCLWRCRPNSQRRRAGPSNQGSRLEGPSRTVSAVSEPISDTSQRSNPCHHVSDSHVPSSSEQPGTRSDRRSSALELRLVLSSSAAVPGMCPSRSWARTGGGSPSRRRHRRANAATASERLRFQSSQLRGAEGDGAGETIALVDAYDNPSFVNSTDPNFETVHCTSSISSSSCPIREFHQGQSERPDHESARLGPNGPGAGDWEAEKRWTSSGPTRCARGQHRPRRKRWHVWGLPRGRGRGR